MYAEDAYLGHMEGSVLPECSESTGQYEQIAWTRYVDTELVITFVRGYRASTDLVIQK